MYRDKTHSRNSYWGQDYQHITLCQYVSTLMPTMLHNIYCANHILAMIIDIMKCMKNEAEFCKSVRICLIRSELSSVFKLEFFPKV